MCCNRKVLSLKVSCLDALHVSVRSSENQVCFTTISPNEQKQKNKRVSTKFKKRYESRGFRFYYHVKLPVISKRARQS